MKHIIAFPLLLIASLSPLSIPAQQAATAPTTTRAAAPTPAPGSAPPVAPTRTEVVPKVVKPADLTIQLLFSEEDKIQLQAQLITTKAQASIQAALAPLQAQYSQIDAAVDAWVKATKLANGWGDNITFDKTDRKFYQTANAAAPTVAPHPEAVPEKK